MKLLVPALVLYYVVLQLAFKYFMLDAFASDWMETSWWVAERLNQSGCGPMRVTGAGSTLYRLFDDRDAAGGVARQIEGLEIDLATAVVAAPVGESALGEQGGPNGNH